MSQVQWLCVLKTKRKKGNDVNIFGIVFVQEPWMEWKVHVNAWKGYSLIKF